MQTHLADFIQSSDAGIEAEAILRKCVHCGFCSATCPTYQLVGDELDSPRGRIYLIKQMLEGAPVSASTRGHLDRCLTCRSCETTCPSGVQYAHLADIGREVAERLAPRPLYERLARSALVWLCTQPGVFAAALALGRRVRRLLPAPIRHAIPPSSGPAGPWPSPRHSRRMIVLGGCVQPVLAPDINAATARVLDRAGISVIEARGAGCCGSLRHHMTMPHAALQDMRALIDAWWPLIEAGAEAIIMTASGCGSTVKEYGHLLRNDPLYRDKAARVSAMTRDLIEVVESCPLIGELTADLAPQTVAFQIPCSLQHGQSMKARAERVLGALGFVLRPVVDSHLCCGSAGVYSMLQPALSGQLREAKLSALHNTGAAQVVTANIGCMSHLAAAERMPITHWIMALDRRLSAAAAPHRATARGD